MKATVIYKVIMESGQETDEYSVDVEVVDLEDNIQTTGLLITRIGEQVEALVEPEIFRERFK